MSPINIADPDTVDSIFPKSFATPDNVTESLAAVSAGLDLILADFGRTPTDASTRLTERTLKLIVAHLKGIERRQEKPPPSAGYSVYRPLLTTSGHFAAIRQIRATYFKLQRLRANIPAPADATDWHSAGQATAGLQIMLNDPAFYLTAPRQEVLADLLQSIKAWRQMYQQHPPTGSPAIKGLAATLAPDRISSALEQVLGPSGSKIPLTESDKIKLADIYEELAAINNPICATVAASGKDWLKDTIARQAVERERRRALAHEPYHRPRRLKPAIGGTPDPSVHPVSEWKKEELLLDVERNAPPGVDSLAAPIIKGDFAYLVGSPRHDRSRSNQSAAQPRLIKLDLKHPTVIPADPGGKPYNYEGYSGTGGNCSIAGGYYIDVGRTLISLYPLDGSDPITLDASRGFDLENPSSAAVLDGKVYASGGRNMGLFIEYDIAQKTTRTLAASKRTEVESPFDNKPPFQFPYLAADPAHDRVVFTFASSSRSEAVGGLWEYNVKTRTFKRLFQPTRDLNMPSPNDAPNVSEVNTALHNQPTLLTPGLNGLFDFEKDNLVKLPALRSWETHNMTCTARAFAVTGHYLWTTWGRAPIGKKDCQQFPPFRADKGPFWRASYIPLDDNRILAYGSSSVWILTVPDYDEAHIKPSEKRRNSIALPPIIPPAAGELPWKSVETLYDHIRDTNNKIDMYVSPQVKGRNVFVLGIGHDQPLDVRKKDGRPDDDKAGFAQLLRYSRDGQPMKPLARLDIAQVWDERFIDDRFVGWSEPPAVVASDAQYYYAAMFGEPCICVFPVDGSPAHKIQLESRATSLAVLDGKIYAASKQTYKSGPSLVAIDPQSNQVDPVLNTSPAAAGSFREYFPKILHVWSDPPRHRILYLACGQKTDLTADGIWEFKPATSEKHLLLPLMVTQASDGHTFPRISWMSTNDDGRLLVATHGGSFVFDPATDKATTISRIDRQAEPLATTPDVPPLPLQSNNNLLAGRAIICWPFAIHDNFVWHDFGRISLDGKQNEEFPALRSGLNQGPGHADSFRPTAIQFLNDKELLICDYYGAWILNLD
jgi:hypothetical protein